MNGEYSRLDVERLCGLRLCDSACVPRCGPLYRSGSDNRVDNYEFCARWVISQSKPGLRVLDYGCGSGQIVKRLRHQGVDAYGCDVFYEPGKKSAEAVCDEIVEGLVREIDAGDGRIPFEANRFDYVLSNQVLEHVEDLDAVLAEIHRVLKPGGTVLSLFPHREVRREGHCGIPLLHRFRRQSRLRYFYAYLLRSAGLGHFKDGRSVAERSRYWCDWLDRWTHYRDKEEILRSFSRLFSDLTFIEDDWLLQRSGSKRLLVSWMPSGARTLIVRKLGGLVFTASKRG